MSALAAPFQAFFRLEVAGGLSLILAAAAALVWANSPLDWLYERIFHAAIEFEVAGVGVHSSVQHVTNDALMALFFVVAGLEIKRELVQGELSSVGKAALPLIAAAGGMLVPALIYLAFNPGGPPRAGWGIPVATDIAFALGCLSLVRRRVPASIVVFLTALAIFDDLGAIVVIALFYGGSVDPLGLLAAVGLTVVLIVLGRLGVRRIWPYAIVGLALWAAVLHAGVHTTVAGVIVGLCVPTRARRPPHDSPVDRWIQGLHRIVVFGIVPLFALANAGVAIGGGTLQASAITVGVFLGLVVGKPIGVLGAIALATAARIAPRPTGATWTHLLGMSIMAGIGFTMSLLIGNLGLGASRAMEDQAKLGVLAASCVAAVVGLLLIRLTSRPTA